METNAIHAKWPRMPAMHSDATAKGKWAATPRLVAHATRSTHQAVISGKHMRRQGAEAAAGPTAKHPAVSSLALLSHHGQRATPQIAADTRLHHTIPIFRGSWGRKAEQGHSFCATTENTGRAAPSLSPSLPSPCPRTHHVHRGGGEECHGCASQQETHRSDTHCSRHGPQQQNLEETTPAVTSCVSLATAQLHRPSQYRQIVTH